MNINIGMNFQENYANNIKINTNANNHLNVNYLNVCVVEWNAMNVISTRVGRNQ